MKKKKTILTLSICYRVSIVLTLRPDCLLFNILLSNIKILSFFFERWNTVEWQEMCLCVDVHFIAASLLAQPGFTTTSLQLCNHRCSCCNWKPGPRQTAVKCLVCLFLRINDLPYIYYLSLLS